jgi:hypothetical protein
LVLVAASTSSRSTKRPASISVHALRFEGVGERRDDVRLADDFLEDPGTPLAGEYLIGHRREGIRSGEPDPRHLKGSTVAASFPT